MKGTLSVWAASDSPIFRHGLKHALRKSRFSVERSGATLTEVLDLSVSPPAVVIFGNVAEPGLEALIRRVRTQWALSAPTRFVMLCGEPAQSVSSQTLRGLVDAILPKNIPTRALPHFLEIVWLGQPVFLNCPERPVSGGPGNCRSRLFSTAPPGEIEPSGLLQPPQDGVPDFAVRCEEAPDAEADGGALPLARLLGGGTVGLSDRENEILQCLRQGASNKVIARQLQISESTVKVHIKSLLKKLRVHNRTQAAILATEARLKSPPQPAIRAPEAALVLQA